MSHPALPPRNQNHYVQNAVMELPARVNVGGTPNGPPNTQFRHEMPVQNPQQLSNFQHQTSWAKFSIPTRGDSLSSGFHFDQRLYSLRVTNDEWHQFSWELVNAAKLAFKEDVAAWSTGITTGTLSSPFILVFAPWAGYAAGKAIHKKTVVKKVKERLMEDGAMRTVLKKWNDGVFADKGFHAWIEIPLEKGELQYGDDTLRGRHPKDLARITKRFRIMIIPNEVVNAPMQHHHVGPQIQHTATPPPQQSPAPAYVQSMKSPGGPFIGSDSSTTNNNERTSELQQQPPGLSNKTPRFLVTKSATSPPAGVVEPPAGQLAELDAGSVPAIQENADLDTIASKPLTQETSNSETVPKIP